MYGMWTAIIYELEKEGSLTRKSVISVKDSRSVVIVPESKNETSIPQVQAPQRGDT